MQGATDSQMQLPAVLDLAASETFLDAMRHACEAESVKVDASNVDVLTVPCIQVILAALKANPGMRVVKPSEAFVRAFADLALEWRQEGQDDQDDQEDAQPDGQAEFADGCFHGGRRCRRKRNLHHSRYSNGRGVHDQTNPDDRRFEDHTGHAQPHALGSRL